MLTRLSVKWQSYICIRNHLRFGQGLAPKPAPPSTSYSTSTVTRVSTITSDVTEEIIITFLNRPITTNYVRTTTMVRSSLMLVTLVICNHYLHPQVVTDIHVSRSSVIIGWMSRAGAEKVQRRFNPWKINIFCMNFTHFTKYIKYQASIFSLAAQAVIFDIWIRPKFDEAEKQVSVSFLATLFTLIVSTPKLILPQIDVPLFSR